jgi:hypothetical protein
MKRLHQALLFLVTLTLGLPIARAQDAVEIVRRSLVYITAEGTKEDTGELVKTEGNGFVTSKDGFVVTNYHLIRKLGKPVGDIQFHVSVGSRNAPPRSASLVSDNAGNDLIRLRINDTVGIESDLIPVSFMSPSELRDKFVETGKIYETDIHTVSFVGGIGGFARDGGRVINLSGPSGYLWVTKIHFTDGQSGSPIFLDSGRVIGIVKGSSVDGNFGYFVPVEFATGMEPRAANAEIEYVLSKSQGSDSASQIASLRKSIEALRQGFQAQVDAIPSLYDKLESQGYLNNKLGLSRQVLAQATCGAQAPRSKLNTVAFAVPRRCVTGSGQSCAAICAEALHQSKDSVGQPASNLRCIDSYQLPGTNLATENESLSLKTLKFGRCDIAGCGPNFCCCAILAGGPVR